MWFSKLCFPNAHFKNTIFKNAYFQTAYLNKLKNTNYINVHVILTLLFTWMLFFTWLAAFLSLLSTASSMVSHARFQPHISKRSTKQILTKRKSYSTSKEISQILTKCKSYKSYSTTEEISQIWMLQLTYIKESNHSTSLILLTTAQREVEPLLYIEFAITPCLFRSCKNSKLLKMKKTK